MGGQRSLTLRDAAVSREGVVDWLWPMVGED